MRRIQTESDPGKGKRVQTTLRVHPITLARVKLFLERSFECRMDSPAKIAREAFQILEGLAVKRFPELEKEISDVPAAMSILGKTIPLKGPNQTAIINCLDEEMEDSQVDALMQTAKALTQKMEGGDISAE